MYDSFLASGLASLDLSPGSELSDFNLYALNAYLLNNASTYGFTNTTQPCFAATPFSAASDYGCVPDGLPGANISTFVYWDHIHPTAGVQALWADGFLAAVPEPSTWAMLLVGFAGLGFAGYRTARKEIAA
jgi:phospholipase/lecithinase/hemolysin